MIPLNQLRIGNYFKWSDSTLIGTGRGIVNIYNMGFYRFMDPIPILGNEQWLLERGFIKDEDGSCTLKIPGKGIITWFRDGSIGLYYSDDDFGFETSAKYIHQIQNLLFDLTNEELKLK